MTDYIPLRQYTAGQDPEAEEADDRLPLPSPRRRRRPKSLRNPGVIAGGVAVIFTLFLILSYSTTGDEQRLRDGGLGSGKGLMEVELPAPGRTISARHPIAQLIELAEEKASEIRDLRESIRTLEDAVANYKETFGLDPPEGFDRWFEFTTSISSTPIPSLIPEAHLSVLPYLSLPAHLLRTRALELQQDKGVFGMTFHPASDADKEEMKLETVEADGLIGVNNTDFMVSYMSPRWDYPDLLKEIVPLLPDAQQSEWPLQMTMCVRDGGCRLSSGWLMEESRKLAREGREWDIDLLEQLEAEYTTRRGWSQTCNPALDEALESAEVDLYPSKSTSTRSFISDHLRSMDFCENPDLLRLNGELIMESDHIMRPLAPILAVSRPMHGADMLGTPTRAVRDQAPTTPWSEKTIQKVVWRGTLTGAFHRDRYDWRASQRHRLSHLVGNTTEEAEAVVLLDRRMGNESSSDGGLEVGTWKENEFIDKWMDVGLVKGDVHNICGPGPTDEACRLDGGPQYPECPEYEPSCDHMLSEYAWLGEMSLEETLPYRYRLDVDGYGWSSRWQKLLSTNSVVLKSTIYPEWWTAQAIPWYHYIPLKYDYTDLWDVLAFLDGTPNADGSFSSSTPASSGSLGSSGSSSKEEEEEEKEEEEEIRAEKNTRGERGKEGLAEEIAKRGMGLAKENLRWEDMQSYMFLLLLEYRRAWSDDREAASYRP